MLIGATTLSLGGCTRGVENSSLEGPRFALLEAICQTLIPKGDGPGAVEAGVPSTFNALVRDWASAETREQIFLALDAIDAAARAQYGQVFVGLSTTRRHDFLSAYDRDNFADIGYRRVRDLAVLLFYMSESGASEELRYEHVPGAWEPSIPITVDTRTWAGAPLS